MSFDPGKLSVRALRWIVTHADGELTLAEAISAFADAERRDVEAAEHAEIQRDYVAYLDRRRVREQELPQRAYDDAKKAAIHARGGAISRENAHEAGKEAADIERLRFEIFEPALRFEEWLEAGRPAVHRTGDAPRGLMAKLTRGGGSDALTAEEASLRLERWSLPPEAA